MDTFDSSSPPSGSSASISSFSTSASTPSSAHTTFTIPEMYEPWQHGGSALSGSYSAGAVPADDWGYDLYHSESRSTDTSSVHNAQADKIAKGFAFSRKKSTAELASGRDQLEAFGTNATRQMASSQPTKFSQVDLYTRPFSSKNSSGGMNTYRSRAQSQSRLAALSRINHKEQSVGAVKLVAKTRLEDIENEGVDSDALSVFTTITTTSTSSKGSDNVPIYGRGGAGRAVGGKVITRVCGSMDELTSEEMPGMAAYVSSAASSTSGTSGGKAFMARLVGKKGHRSNIYNADRGSISSGIGNSSISIAEVEEEEIQVLPSGEHQEQSVTQQKYKQASRESLATIHMVSQTKEAPVAVYGRGGAGRKKLGPKETNETPVKEKEDYQKSRSRAATLISSMRKGDKMSESPQKNGAERNEEPVKAFGRGGAARKKHL